jgi:hypothetical protein
MRRLELLGYWFHDDAPDAWPRPQLLVGRWRQRDRDAVLAWLRTAPELVRYPHTSWCRFACGERRLGRSERSDGTFVWPDGLAHYVAVHGVVLPPRFVAHVRAHDGVLPKVRLGKPRRGLYDAVPWLAFGRRRGACLDLDGWVVPDATLARRLDRELGPTGRDDGRVVACNANSREVLLRNGLGALAIHDLGPERRPVRRLDGWDEWPVLGAKRPRRSPTSSSASGSAGSASSSSAPSCRRRTPP